MGQRTIERRLRETGARLKQLRSELAVVDEQLQALSEDTEDKGLRAMVAETPGADVEYREARLHSEAMSRHRQSVIDSIKELETRQDELLDQMQR